MKICRFSQGKRIYYGISEGSQIFPIENAKDIFSDTDIWQESESLSLHDVKLLSPVAPSKIVCVGRNYLAHAKELGNEVPKEPLLFLKAPSSIVTRNEPIFLPPQSDQVEHEGELGVVIRRACKKLIRR